MLHTMILLLPLLLVMLRLKVMSPPNQAFSPLVKIEVSVRVRYPISVGGIHKSSVPYCLKLLFSEELYLHFSFCWELGR
jgi:hypothetical protein